MKKSQGTPRWRVSAPHREPSTRRDGEQPQSYDIRHAREVGASRTLCGAAALGWPFLWDLRFEPYADDFACPECSEQLLALTAASTPAREPRNGY